MRWLSTLKCNPWVPFRPKWKLNPLDLHPKREEEMCLPCFWRSYQSCSKSTDSPVAAPSSFDIVWHELQRPKNKANAGHRQKVTPSRYVAEIHIMGGRTGCFLFRRLNRTCWTWRINGSLPKLILKMMTFTGKSPLIPLFTRRINLSFLLYRVVVCSSKKEGLFSKNAPIINFGKCASTPFKDWNMNCIFYRVSSIKINVCKVFWLGGVG